MISPIAIKYRPESTHHDGSVQSAAGNQLRFGSGVVKLSPPSLSRSTLASVKDAISEDNLFISSEAAVEAE